MDAQPLTTPEARAGLRQRLIDHAATIADTDLARLYRDDWLRRFDEIAAAPHLHAPAARRLQTPGSFKNGRFVPPEPPVGGEARAIAASGIDTPTARALMLGFAYFPEELPAHCEQLAALAIADQRTAKMRDELVNAAFSGAALDRASLATILGTDGATGAKAPRYHGLFLHPPRQRPGPCPKRSRGGGRDHRRERRKWKRPWSDATERLKRDLTDEALEEQQRLVAAQHGLRRRLASLAGTD